jgi:c(7)-type cytochrome triheme protein
MKYRPRLILVLPVCILPLWVTTPWAEYADVILNRRSAEADVRPVIFPHWFHRIRYRCSACHVDLNIQMKAGGTDITMESIVAGEYCGACHNGDIAWSTENCDLCHSGKADLETGIRGGHQTGGPGIY